MDDSEPVLTTERVRIRRLQGTDAAAIAAYRSQPEVARFQSWDESYSPAAATELIESVAGHRIGAVGWAQLGIETLDGELIGDIGICGHTDGSVELGYSLEPGHWHQGLATEALAAVVDMLIGDLAVTEVHAEVEPRNLASIALLRRLDFTLGATLPDGFLRFDRTGPTYRGAVTDPRPDMAAFLRAVNVAGHNKLPMADLREMFATIGLPGAKTYVQSGNVVFHAGDAGKDRLALAARLESAILEHFGLKSPVILRSEAELAAAIKASPYAADEPEATRVHIGFLASKPTAAAVKGIDYDRSPGDEFCIIGSDVHIHYAPTGAGRSKLAAAWFDKALGTTLTARNLRSCQAVLDLLRA